MTTRLDPEQHAAATSPHHRIRVIAGAGSGKTRTLVARVGYLLEQGVHPARICAITFTKKAAEELAARLAAAHGPEVVKPMQVGTIHSLGAMILGRERPGRGICDEGMRVKILRKGMALLKDLPYGTKRPEFRDVLRACRAWKAFGTAPPSAAIERVLHAYQQTLKTERLWDFDDLIYEAWMCLENHPESRANWQGRWLHILVDEVQDTDARQWRLLYWLVNDTVSLYLVGDLAQSIYRFRGARPDMLMGEVEEWFGPFQDYTVATNYRSRPLVVQVANAIVRQTPEALALQPHREEHPFVVQLLQSRGPAEEGGAIARALAEAHACGHAWGDMAILVRVNAQSEALEAACLRHKIPVMILHGTSFYGRAEVLDLLAYLQIACIPDVVAPAMDRIYNRPSRYLGAAWKAAVEEAGGWDAFFAAEGRIPGLKGNTVKNSVRLYTELLELRRLYERGATPRELLLYVLDGMGYRQWKVGAEATDTEDEVIADNLDALVAAADGWITTPDFLAYAEMCRQRASAKSGGVDRVQIATVHRAKGLEWPVVAVAGITKHVVPHKQGHKPEERRIFYVAVTRAKDRLILSTFGEPSPYWHEVVDALDVPPSSRDKDRQIITSGDDFGHDAPYRGGKPTSDGAGVCVPNDGQRQGDGVG